MNGLNIDTAMRREPRARDSVMSDALDLVSDAIILSDPEGYITHCNRAAEALYGWPAAELVGYLRDDVLETLHPHGLPAIADVLMEKGTWDGEFSRKTRAGSRVQLDVKRSLSRSDGGRAAVIETTRPSRSLSAADPDAEIAAHRYRNIFQAMAAAFWELDFTLVRQKVGKLLAEGVTDFATYFAEHPEFIQSALESTMVLDVNDKTVSLYEGGSRENMIGRSVEPYWPKESRHVYAQSLIAAFQKRPSHYAETRFSTLSGKLFDGLFTVCWPPGHEGRGSVLVGVIDITDRKQVELDLQRSEVRYRSLFHALALGLVQVDTRALFGVFSDLRARGVTDIRAHAAANPDFIHEAMDVSIISEVNDAAVTMLGGRTPADLIGKSVRNIWSPVGYPTFVRCLEVGFTLGEPFREDTVQRRLDGREINVHFSFSPSTALRSQGLVLVGLADTTEWVRAQKALHEMRSQFAHAARLSMLGELTASIAHEINQPLAAISAYGVAGSRLLARETPDCGKVRIIQEQMVADAKRAADIVNRIRGMAAKAEATRQTVNLNEVIDETLMFLKMEMADNGVTPVVALDGTVGPVLADRVQVQQVIVNIAMNAIQQMKRGVPDGRKLFVSSCSDPDGGTVIAIEDTGGGIPPDVHDRLFESFFTTKEHGLGIGLSICRSIIDAHGGSIRAENASGGARFTLHLPRC